MEEGFLPDGAARRALGGDAPGNLRDQGDAGSGLLAFHAVTGEPAALEAARRVAEALERDFWDEERLAFRNVSRRADLPDLIRDAEADPGWNGTAMRFLAELDALTGEDRWGDRLERSLLAWADRVPVDGSGIAELGRAALRSERPVPVLIVVAEPGTERGDELRALAARVFDPLVLVRWIPPGRRGDAAAFGVRAEEDPAVYFAWDEVSPPLRDAEALLAWWDAARRRVRR
jgi:uncharacterized protein YyaL (SSP411 family)